MWMNSTTAALIPRRCQSVLPSPVTSCAPRLTRHAARVNTGAQVVEGRKWHGHEKPSRRHYPEYEHDARRLRQAAPRFVRRRTIQLENDSDAPVVGPDRAVAANDYGIPHLVHHTAFALA